MSEITLTDRYVAAVVRAVPEDARDDVAAELEASIRDQVEARIDRGEPSAVAERAVLVELGDPGALAASYAGRTLSLVGPRVYLDWKRALTALLWIVVPISALGAVLVTAIDGAAVGELIATGVVTIMQVGLQVAFWTTLVFAILDRTGARAPLGPWTPERLPTPAPKGGGVADAIAGGVTVVIAIGAIAWDQTITFVVLQREPTSVLTHSPLVLVLLVAVLVAQSVPHAVAARTGAWTSRLAIANAAVSVLTGALLIALVAGGLVLGERITSLLEDAGVAPVAAVVAIVVLVAGTVWNVVDGFLRARRAQRA